MDKIIDINKLNEKGSLNVKDNSLMKSSDLINFEMNSIINFTKIEEEIKELVINEENLDKMIIVKAGFTIKLVKDETSDSTSIGWVPEDVTDPVDEE